MSLTNREALQTLIATQNEEVDEKDSSVFQNDNSFRFKVMSSPAPYSGPATANQDPELLNQTNIDSKYLFTGRILNPGMPHQKFLEDPCNESVSPDAGAGSRLYALHTKVRFSKAGEMPQFQPGDIIESEMLAGGLTNLYDLQFCDMTGVKDIFQNQQISKAGACAKLGNLFGGGGAPGFIGNVAGLPLTASDKLAQTAEEPKLITILRNKGYKVYEDGTINSIGVRSSNRVPDSFDDVMHLIWFKDGMWNDIGFQITTDPGLSIINRTAAKEYLNAKGAAQLKEGQYVDAYIFGKHSGKPGLQQVGEVTVYRDNNADAVLDWESSGGGEDTGKRFGINIHRSGKNSQQVSTWSAGCQVFQKNSDFEKAWGIWKSTGQTRVTYTLLLWSDLTGTSNAVVSAERPWDTENRDSWVAAGDPPETDPTYGVEGVDWGYTS
jgi:hypothetical protein